MNYSRLAVAAVETEAARCNPSVAKALVGVEKCVFRDSVRFY